MGWAIDRFRHHVTAGGMRNAVARASSRALDLAAGHMRRASERLVTPEAASRRLPDSIRDILDANRPLRDGARGMDVLVVASGPSAKGLDAALAGGRPAIVVNEMFAPVRAAGIKLAAVVVHDPIYFSGEPAMDRMLADASAAARCDDALMMVPARHVPRLARLGMVQPGRTLAFFDSGCPIPAMPRPAGLIDLAQAVPSLQTVSHAAIVGALYLGYARVSLIGIDLTFIGFPSVPIRHGYGQNPYYPTINERNAADAFEGGHGWDWPFVLRDVAAQLEAYAWLAEGARRNGRRLINLAGSSLLTTVREIEGAPPA